MRALLAIHLGCAAFTISFFLFRGLMLLRDEAFTRRGWVRRTAAGIDTLLLASGILLVWLTSQSPWHNPWLAAKLSALLVYVLLGMVAFHWARTRMVRISSWLAAIVTFAYIVAVALSRNPWPLPA